MPAHFDFINSWGSLVQARHQKAKDLSQEGTSLYPNSYRPEHKIDQIKKVYKDTSATELEQLTDKFTISGRIMSRRDSGKSIFFDLLDSGGRLQVYAQEKRSPIAFSLLKKLDIGDIVGVSGRLFKTKTAELTLVIETLELVTKGLLPLPEKYHEMSVENKYRQRYVDLIMNKSTRKVFILRSKIIAALRRFMTKHGFMEVETPMMHPIPGGAAAKPFITHHQALDMPFYLRIAPELYLKRLLVGGFERVFEINRSFRNEGFSPQHNPEFTMMEFYQSYADINDLMDFTEEMFDFLRAELGFAKKIVYQGTEINLQTPWRRLPFLDSLIEIGKVEPDVLTDRIAALNFLKSINGEEADQDVLGKIQAKIFDELVEPKLIDPTFITLYPADISPLARRSDTNSVLTDRFELFIYGREMSNGFAELNDPLDQRERFLAQVAERKAGDEESMHMDEDYIRALMYGMPPAAGEGVGIDRLVMLLADVPNIRDVIFFPNLRPEVR